MARANDVGSGRRKRRDGEAVRAGRYRQRHWQWWGVVSLVQTAVHCGNKEGCGVVETAGQVGGGEYEKRCGARRV